METPSYNHIVEILNHGSAQKFSSLYFVDMEYCDVNLEEYIHGSKTSVHGLQDYAVCARGSHFSFFVCAIWQQILSGVVFLHDHGKIHHDLNPRNGTKQILAFLICSIVLVTNTMVENCQIRSGIRRRDVDTQYD
jgi:serine/threonine protein kinase